VTRAAHAWALDGWLWMGIMMPNGTDDSWVPNWVQVEKAKRDELQTRYRVLISEVSAILFDLDPIGINFEDNTDEYDAEAGTILPRLETCLTAENLRSVVHQEFIHWFGPDIAGEEARYHQAANRIWGAWTRHKGTK
jgi:hypothetical protein